MTARKSCSYFGVRPPYIGRLSRRHMVSACYANQATPLLPGPRVAEPGRLRAIEPRPAFASPRRDAQLFPAVTTARKLQSRGRRRRGAAANCGPKHPKGASRRRCWRYPPPATSAEAARHFSHFCGSRPGPAGPLSRTPVVKADSRLRRTGAPDRFIRSPPPAVDSEASSGAAGDIRDNAAFILSCKEKTRLSAGQLATSSSPGFTRSTPCNTLPTTRHPLICLGY